MQYNENIRYHIDRLECEAGTVTIVGWLCSELTITRIYLVDDEGERLRLELKSYGLPSADVALHHGLVGAKARFSEKVLLPEGSNFQPKAFLLQFQNGFERKISLSQSAGDHLLSFQNSRPLVKLGIGITTYRRRSSLENVLKKLKLHTKTDFELVVADDGSGDDTLSMLRALNISHITGKNRGVAWNKNRALHHLNSRCKCDVIILIEDDSFPSVDAWEKDWIKAATTFGHINLAGHWFKEKFVDGLGTPESPISCFSSSGQCVAFSRKTVERVGYFDSRFGRYGYEHAEHSQRCIRVGFGGIYQPQDTNAYIYYLIRGGLTVGHLADVHGDDLARNAVIYHAVKNDQVHRWAWRGDEEMSEFLSEQENAILF